MDLEWFDGFVSGMFFGVAITVGTAAAAVFGLWIWGLL